jgi:hypothetical protein
MKSIKLKYSLAYCIFALCILGFSDCRKDEHLKREYLVFGTFFGFCAGPHCVDIYKIEDGKLLEDTTDLYPMQKNSKSRVYIQRTQGKFELAKKLLSDFPSRLLSEPAQIGNPDDHDQGGILIGIFKDGHEQFWMIDNDKTRVPDYLQPYLEEVKQVVMDLR